MTAPAMVPGGVLVKGDKEVLEAEEDGEAGLAEGLVDGVEELEVGRKRDFSSAESQVREALERLDLLFSRFVAKAGTPAMSEGV